MNDAKTAQNNEAKTNGRNPVLAGAASPSISTLGHNLSRYSPMKLNRHAIQAVVLTAALSLAGQQAMASNGRPPGKGHKSTTTTISPLMVGAGGMLVVTGATGGEAISASTAGGSWTTLTGPVITETFARDNGGPGLGTIILSAPAGFEFNPNAAVAVLVKGDGPFTINNVGNGGTVPVVVTPTTITLNITSVSRGGYAYPDQLIYQNIQVRPTSAAVLASGNITESGTCDFRGLTLTTGTWGNLQEVGGVIPNVILADPLGDWDGDGRSNLMEYALGTDPTNPNDNSTGMSVWIQNDSGSNYLAMGYKHRITAGLPIQYQPEVSGDKQTWVTGPANLLSLGTTAIDAQFEWVVVRDLVPLSPTTPRFIRLTVLEN